VVASSNVIGDIDCKHMCDSKRGPWYFDGGARVSTMVWRQPWLGSMASRAGIIEVNGEELIQKSSHGLNGVLLLLSCLIVENVVNDRSFCWQFQRDTRERKELKVKRLTQLC